MKIAYCEIVSIIVAKCAKYMNDRYRLIAIGQKMRNDISSLLIISPTDSFSKIS